MVDHPLIYCRGVLLLWHSSLSLMGISRIQPFFVKDVVMAGRRGMRKSWVCGVGKVIALAIRWCT